MARGSSAVVLDWLQATVIAAGLIVAMFADTTEALNAMGAVGVALKVDEGLLAAAGNCWNAVISLYD
jgi:hypothetical protein